MTKLRQS